MKTLILITAIPSLCRAIDRPMDADSYEDALMNADIRYTEWAAHMWRKIAAYWSLGSIHRPYWPEVGE